MKHQAMLKYYRKNRGSAYKSMYRTAIGLTAAARLVILTMLYPLANAVWDRNALRDARAKWKAILNWALGRQHVATGKG